MSSIVASLPPATRALTGTLIGFSVTLALLRLTLTEGKLHVISWSRNDSALAFPWLVLVPGQSFIYPWTLITSSFCETTLFEFLLSVISLPLFGRYLERIWGATELVKFTFVVLVGSNIIAWFLAILQFAVLRNDYAIYGTQYHGLTALQCGFLVALTQLIPEHQLQIFNGRLKVQVKNFPMAYVTVSTVLCLLGFISPWILIQFGWLISWVWLRFFKMSESGFRGDRSEAFSFVTWFPPFLHKPITILSNVLFRIFTRLHIVQPWQYSDVESGPGMAPMPSGPSRVEAERRRAMALKALDQRMARTGSGSGRKGTGGSSKGGLGASSLSNGDAAESSRATANDVHIEESKEADSLLKNEEDDGDIGASTR